MLVALLLWQETPETVAMAQASKFMSFHVEADDHVLCDTEHGCMEVRKFDDSHQ